MRLDPVICIHVTKDELGCLMWICQNRINQLESQLKRTFKGEYVIIDSLKRSINNYRDLQRRLECAKYTFNENDKMLDAINDGSTVETLPCESEYSDDLEYKPTDIDDVILEYLKKKWIQYGN
jgi:conjugal transfer/entry exclusion protein